MVRWIYGELRREGKRKRKRRSSQGRGFEAAVIDGAVAQISAP